LKQLKAELFEASDDANPIIRWQDWQFRRFEHALHVVPISTDLSSQTFQWNGQGCIELPEGLGELMFKPNPDVLFSQGPNCCVLNDEDGDISIRFGGYGDKFKPAGEANSKALKQWFKLWKIPPWERSKIAIIVQNNRVKALVVANKITAAHDAVADEQHAVSSERNKIYVSIRPCA
jgi:tRNA(Ile)-lysidine synthase